MRAVQLAWCVAGIIPGTGDKPGILLDRQQAGKTQSVALLCRVFYKVDAQFGAIEMGDLLTTSPTSALRPLNMGQGLIPMLIALQ